MSEPVYGLQFGDLPEGWTPLRALIIIECIDLTDESPDEAGRKRLSIRHSDDLDAWTAVGLVECAAADLKKQFVATLEEG